MNKREEDYLAVMDRGFLATIGKNQNPTIVPVCFAYAKGKIYSALDDKPKTSQKLARVSNIERDDRVAFIVDNYSQKWKKLSYLLVHGRARLVRDSNEAEVARNLLAEKYPQYRRVGLGTEVIAISVEKTKLWEFNR